MSLVGTRPPTMDEYNQYELHHKSRLAAKPGLTGMWQVSGRSDFTDFEEMAVVITYANGLISTITQIFSYMALLEAGIRQAAKNELFKCIAKKDEEQISVVATTAKRYFQRVTVLYGIGVIILSVMAPVFVVSNLDKEVIFFAAFFEGMAGVLSFYFVQTPSSILSAFGEDYVNTTVEVFNKGISYLVRIG